ncbi:IS1/IS1595 family N-terminal zinc-binding domain-containing protein [Capnocytophaga stomatis]|uniref:IS1/IS1595 family N-terminal zinc-binding domain-containing protein n=1 Tax=Capnocytophaga stomatis TaxID=1848904 RepID=UPI0038650025
MQITITLHCPNCQSTKIVKNGKKSYGKQNYLCKDCYRQFIGEYNLYKIMVINSLPKYFDYFSQRSSYPIYC